MHKKTPITIKIFFHNSLRNIQQQDINIIHIFFLKRLKGHYFLFSFYLVVEQNKQTTNSELQGKSRNYQM